MCTVKPKVHSALSSADVLAFVQAGETRDIALAIIILILMKTKRFERNLM